jgi:hydroxylamine dehydrogenase
MKKLIGLLVFFGVVTGIINLAGAEAMVSEATQECLDCHASIHPGIVESWQRSRHAAITPKEALTVEGLARKISSQTVPETLREISVGCAECHLLRPEEHSDSFEHNGYQVHVVVSPKDCAVCHVEEQQQYDENLMAHARNNLAGNALYGQLQRSILGSPRVESGKLSHATPDAVTRADACFSCHGTELKTIGTEVRETALGEMEFPKIEGWPNQGVGRINLDGSRGACTACHTRHDFSMEMARKPYTCMQCHVGPDVPAYKIYAASKHGNIYAAKKEAWDFKAVPWTIGKDFSAPTCAACHISLVTNTDEEVLVKRSHAMSDRLPWRIYGLIYAHPHPIDPDTSKIRNKDGLPLPTDLSGGFAQDFLIDKAEQQKRTKNMQAMCLGCHSGAWVQGHWQKFEQTIRDTNDTIQTGTEIIQQLWQAKRIKGLAEGENPFDEAIERKWVDTWLFHGNSIRFASAMAGGGDYGVFAGGRYQLMQRIAELSEFTK